MKDFEKLLKKNASGKKMDPDVKSSKMGVLKELHKMMGGMMGDGIKEHMSGLKKVTVAAPDKSGLSMGLEKAKEMLSGEESPEMGEEEGEEESEMSDMSEEELDAKIKELEALKMSKHKMKF